MSKFKFRSPNSSSETKAFLWFQAASSSGHHAIPLGCMTFGESLPLFGQSPLGCPHPTDIFCCQSLGLEKGLRPGTGDPAGLKVGGQTVHSTTPPVVPPHHHPSFHFMGLAQLRKAWDNPAHWGLEVASCLCPLLFDIPIPGSTKTKHFPREQREKPYTHLVALRVGWHPGPRGPQQGQWSLSPSRPCQPEPSLPRTVSWSGPLAGAGFSSCDNSES